MRTPSQKTAVLIVTGILLVLAGCLGSPLSITEKQCGQIAGVGGCELVIYNDASEPKSATVTVEAITADGSVAAKNSKTVRIDAQSEKNVLVEAVSVGSNVHHYEATLS